jgi:magnesium transporter
VVDPTYRVLGSVDLSRLLRTQRDVSIDSIMDAGRQVLLATADQEAVARQFERYDLKSAPVVDASDRLVGVVTVDDVVEVIEGEADEDLRRLSGLGDERITDSVRQIVPARFWWLFINLLTAILASAVIKQFDATIEHMVALAVLMPIVASMGGNAGTQTMTVAVRALATGELGVMNTARVVLRETMTGLINGVASRSSWGLLSSFWFGSNRLGAVIGAAMVINLLAAALAGIFIPLGLKRLDFDPAVSSTVFVTTVTTWSASSRFWAWRRCGLCEDERGSPNGRDWRETGLWGHACGHWRRATRLAGSTSSRPTSSSTGASVPEDVIETTWQRLDAWRA